MKPSIENLIDGRIILAFSGSNILFDTAGQAQRYLEDRGFAVGRQQAHAPRGIMFGRYNVPKWRNLRPLERASLHGQVIGNGRTSPITVEIFETAPLEAKRAVARPAVDRVDYRGRAIVLASDLAAVATILFCVGSLAYVGLHPIWVQRPASTGKYALRISEAPAIAAKAP